MVLSGLDGGFLLGDVLLLDLEGVVHYNYKDYQIVKEGIDGKMSVGDMGNNEG